MATTTVFSLVFAGLLICESYGIPMRDFASLDEGIPMRDFASLDEVCEDDPNYADACPEKAAIENYCNDQEDFMRKNCPKSCKFCSEPVKPPAPAAVCEDDPNYADACPEKAAVENYCHDQEKFMRKNCPKSCGFCSSATAQPVVSTESVKPPGIAAVCGDDPEYEESCKSIAATTGFCEEQKEFTKKHCALSCKWCELPTNKAPIQGICEEDLPKWAARCPEWAKIGECDDPRKQTFLFHYCPKSCKRPCKTEPPPNPSRKPPSPPAFCRDRDINCGKWKSLGVPCDGPRMPIYCGVTCGICKEPTPEECFDKADNCEDLKKAGFCTSTIPKFEYEVKTNCLETCEFCVPDFP